MTASTTTPWHGPDDPLLDPGAGELDALLASIETSTEGGRVLQIPITPTVIRWLLRGTFECKGRRARMIGGTLRGSEFVPTFSEIPRP